MQIKIAYLCGCECTLAAQDNSPKCSEKGSLECAICKCNEGYYGDICQCNRTNSENSRDTLQSCLSNPTDNTTICSKQGSCLCGQCICSIEKVCAEMYWEVSWRLKLSNPQ